MPGEKASPKSSVCLSLSKFFSPGTSCYADGSSVSSHLRGFSWECASTLNTTILIGAFGNISHLYEEWLHLVYFDFTVQLHHLMTLNASYKLIPVYLLLTLFLSHFFPILKSPGLLHCFLHRWHLHLWSASLPLSVSFPILLCLKD